MRTSVQRLVALITLMGVFATSPILAQQDDGAGPSGLSRAATANADKVDGRHAVGASTTRVRRAGKLVATNRYGYLPANIIKKVDDADRLGWHESTSFVRRSQVAIMTVEGPAVSISNGAGSTTKNADATCPSGWKTVGGGFKVWDKDVQVKGSYPKDGSLQTWQTKADLYVAFHGDATFRSYARCLTTKAGGSARATAARTEVVSPSAADTGTAGLNAHTVDGKHAVGQWASRSKRAGKLVATDFEGYLPADIIKTARNADKLDGFDATDFVRFTSATVVGPITKTNKDGFTTVQATCPEGDFVTSGGFLLENEKNLNNAHLTAVMESRPIGEGTWQVQFYTGQVQGVIDTVQAWAMCLSW